MDEFKQPSAPENGESPRSGWELACDGILRRRFGRRPTCALARAMLQLTAEEAATRVYGQAKANERATLSGHFRRWFTVPRLAWSAALLLVICAVGWQLWQRSPLRPPQSGALMAVCTVRDVQDARWGGNSAKVKVGSPLPLGLVQLDAGLADLEFASGARVAIEGPARLNLTGPNSLELRAGKLSAEVFLKRAHGFMVQTPSATVVDLGTRFGVAINPDSSSEVQVFAGTVVLTPGHDGARPSRQLARNTAVTVDIGGVLTPAVFNPDNFPRPGCDLLVHPANCGFDGPGATFMGSVPTSFAFWSGPAYKLATATESIRPFEGAGMLRFLKPPARNGQPAPRDSEVWQLMDLRPQKELSGGEPVTATLSAYFNRVRGDTAHIGSKFGLTLAAFRGSPSNGPELWAQRHEAALVMADKELATDNDPNTWEKLEVSATLPPETDFVIVQMRAIAPAQPDSSTPFPGHFADLVDLKLSARMHPSSANR